MEVLLKWVVVTVCAFLNAIVLLSAANMMFDISPTHASAIGTFQVWYAAFADTAAGWISGNSLSKFSIFLVHYFSVSILTLVIGHIGYWQTFDKKDEIITSIVHFFLWPIAFLWHVNIYFIFDRFANERARIDHIPRSSVIWAYWASVAYFYVFWALSIALMIYFLNS